MIMSHLRAVTALVLIVCGLPLGYAHAADLRVISFNIQFLGSFAQRRNADIADMLSPYDLVFVQELVAPPFDGQFPDGTAFTPDAEAKQFFDAMEARGFKYVLSEEDTGKGKTIHDNSTATEWFAAFYKVRKVEPASDLFTGFLADDRSRNPDYDRVPYAFGFRAGAADIVFISVHLHPDKGRIHRARRAHEMRSIFSWIDSRPLASETMSSWAT